MFTVPQMIIVHFFYLLVTHLEVNVLNKTNLCVFVHMFCRMSSNYVTIVYSRRLCWRLRMRFRRRAKGWQRGIHNLGPFQIPCRRKHMLSSTKNSYVLHNRILLVSKRCVHYWHLQSVEWTMDCWCLLRIFVRRIRWSSSVSCQLLMSIFVNGFEGFEMLVGSPICMLDNVFSTFYNNVTLNAKIWI